MEIFVSVLFVPDFDTLLESLVEGELELAVSKLFLSDSNFIKTVVGLVDKLDSMDQAM